MSDIIRAGDIDIPSIEKFAKSGKLFSSSFFTAVASTVFNDRILIRNPSGSGITMFIYSIESQLEIAVNTSVLHELALRIFHTPTLSSTGTLQGMVNLNISSVNTPDGEIYENPTANPNGTELFRRYTINSPAIFKPKFGLILSPGDDLLVQLRTVDSANDLVNVIIWGEE